MRQIQLFLALLLILTAPVFAQSDSTPKDDCGDEETLLDCYRRFALTPAAKDITENAAEERVTPSLAPGGVTSVVDLLPSFLVSGGLLGLEETDEAYTLAKVFEIGESLRLELRGDIFREPQIFEPVREQLPEDLGDEALMMLQNEIGDFDKADFRLVLGWEGMIGDHRFGRDLDDYWKIVRPWVAASYAKSLGPSLPSTPIESWMFSPAVSAIDDRLGNDSILSMTPKKLRGKGISDDEVDEVVSSLLETVAGMESLRRSVEDSMTSSAAEVSSQVAELITNQPQLLLEASYRERESLTGPTEWLARFCFEWGLSGNVNDFLSWAAKNNDCTSYECFQRWRGGNSALGLSEETAVDRGHRLAIVAEYTSTEAMHIDADDLGIDDPDFVYELEESDKLTGSLVYGINLEGVQLPNVLGLFNPSIVPVDKARFDLEAAYEYVDDDPMRQSRWTASAGLSQKMSNKTILSIGVAWAEKPEYLGEVDEELSANLGLRWSFYGPDDSKKKGDGDDNGG